MIVQLLTSFTGALGFCLVFHLRRRYMFAASLGGLLTCGVYLQNHIVIGLILAAIFISRNGHHHLVEPKDITLPEVNVLITQMDRIQCIPVPGNLRLVVV